MWTKAVSLVALLLLGTTTRLARPETAPSGALQQLRAIVQPGSDELASAAVVAVPSDGASSGPDGSWMGLGEALELFSPAELERSWRRADEDKASDEARMRDSIVPDCRRHVERYLDGLRKRELWALKSEYWFHLPDDCYIV
ncbi:hypothetical protein QAD02_017227 [Eretmocerus hayati]|uniref:Uncharacterized protein n=1 Tax=Eretmocerus hayati TaxID=131215 RepID=A0ACC2PDD9_9HYME|nr:hypothetical protein QAD02_017227 [Eretmocerus hayati]